MTCVATHPRAREVARERTTPSPAAVVRLLDVSKVLDERTVLQDLNLRIGAGEFVTILGANGAGKSTLLKLLALLTPPTAGRIELFGEPAGRASRVDSAHHQARWAMPTLRGRIGMIGHQTMLYRQLTARENLMFFAKLYGLTDAQQRSDEMLEMVGLERRGDEPVKCFSRGMSQRLAIARALLHDPELLLADEPFSGLDAAAGQTLEELFLSLNRSGKTIVLVHHDIEKALRLAQRAIVLREGYVVIDELAPVMGGSLRVEDVLAEVTEP